MSDETYQLSPVDEKVLHHLGEGKPRFAGECNSPGVFKRFSGGFIFHHLIAREKRGEETHVAGSLGVVEITEVVDPTAFDPEIT